MFSQGAGSGGSSLPQPGGFIESNQNVIQIPDIPYSVFEQIMSYLYSGKFNLEDFIRKELKAVLQQKKDSLCDKKSILQTMHSVTIDYLIEFLRVADEYLLEEVKSYC